MSGRPQGSFGWRWDPLRLGESIPIARGLKLSRVVGFLILIAALAAVAWRAYALYHPEVGLLAEVDRKEVVPTALRNASEASSSWTHWAPRVSLGGGTVPDLAPTPSAPLWTEPDPLVPNLDPQAERQARMAFEEGRFRTAAELYGGLTTRFPSAWKYRYNEGLSLYRVRLVTRAVGALKKARELLVNAGFGTASTQRRMALVFTNYALGEPELREAGRLCLEACSDLKDALSALLQIARNSPNILTRDLPFQLMETELDSYDVWLRLNEIYIGCETYPAGYFPNYGSTRYRAQPDADPDLPHNRDGLWPDRARACLDSNGNEGDCWWRLNYGFIWYYSQDIVRGPDWEFKTSWPALARLYQHLTILLLQDGNRLDNARSQFAHANRLVLALEKEATAEQSNLVQQLRKSLDEIGAYLAKAIEEDSSGAGWGSLAESYRERAISDLPFGQARGWQLRAMAHALSERWLKLINEGKADVMAGEISRAKDQIASSYFESLNSWWEDQVQPDLQGRLIRAMREVREQDAARAIAIRDSRETYLGDGWRLRATLVWFEPHLAELGLWLLVSLLLVGIWWLTHRFVVYPYLLYNTNYYQREFARRYRERRKDRLPFIAPELEAERRRLGQARSG